MIKYLYVCSAGHSGSTLLDLLIGAHSRVASLGELVHLPKNLALNTPCTCGKPIRECQAWSEVSKVIADRAGIDILKDPYGVHMGFIGSQVAIDHSHQTRRYRSKWRLIHAYLYAVWRSHLPLDSFARPFWEGLRNSYLVYDAVRMAFDVDVVVDSSKHYVRAVGLYKLNPESFRIIMLTRDGRGVFHSGLKRNWSKERSLGAWLNHNARMIPLLREYVAPEHILHVKYEDLVANPRSVLERICDFSGLAYEDAMAGASTKIYHMPNGNPMRFGFSQIKPDMGWMAALTEADLKYFEAKAGALNRKLGYQ